MVGLMPSSVQSNGLLGRWTDSNLDVTESDLFLSNSITGDYTIAGIDNTLYLGGNYTRRKVEHHDDFGLVDTPVTLQSMGLSPLYLRAARLHYL